MSFLVNICWFAGLLSSPCHLASFGWLNPSLVEQAPLDRDNKLYCSLVVVVVVSWNKGAQLDYDWLTERFKGFASLDRFVIVHHHPHLCMNDVDANVQWRRPPPLQRSQQKSRHIIINHALIECSTRTVTYSNPSILNPVHPVQSGEWA